MNKYHKTTIILLKLSQNYRFKKLYHKTIDLVNSCNIKLQITFHNGTITFQPRRMLWKSCASPKCKIFVWLAIQNRCWIADRLARRGLPHREMCPLCDQEQETVQHILSTCVFAQHFWFKILTPLGFQDRAPRNGEISFADWWRQAFKKLPKEVKKGVNMMIILGAWTIGIIAMHVYLRELGHVPWSPCPYLRKNIICVVCLRIGSTSLNQVNVLQV